MSELTKDTVLECKDLRISFSTLSGTVKAVRGISFDLKKGKTLAIVGESGSGKSVTSRAILGILANNKIVEGGQILYDGKDLLSLSEDQFTSIRGSKISMIFQDPLSSLNPIMKVGKQLTEPMFLKAKTTRKEAKKRYKTYISSLVKDLEGYDVTSDEVIAKLNLITTGLKEKEQVTKLENANTKLNAQIAKMSSEKAEAAKAIIEENNGKIAAILKHIDDLNAEVTAFFADTHNAEVLKDILNKSYKDYIEKLHVLKQALINFKEEIFITSFDYKARIKSIYKEVDALIDARLEKDAEFHNLIEAENAKKGTEEFNAEAIKKLHADKKAYDDEIIAKINDLRLKAIDTVEFDSKLALTRIKEIQTQITNCNYPYAVENDDIVSVFGTSFKKYILSYLESITLNAENFKFLDSFNDYNKGIKNDIPAKIRAKRRETIVPFYEFYERMVTSLNHIVQYIQTQLIDAKFDLDAYYVSFVDKIQSELRLAQTKVRQAEAKKRALELLEEVGIPDPERRFYQYPFEFSGGMRQRIVIAIALSSNPEILICDEPTTALDVTIQAQILELINKMKVEHNLSIIFITHDLGVVANMADDIAVMYAGKIVEMGSVYDIFYDPRHPYTWALLGSMPDLDTKDKLEAIPGTPPNMLLPPKGDAFAARNKFAMKIDYRKQPPFFKISDSHSAATWLLHENAPSASAPKVVVDRIRNSLKKNPDNTPVYDNKKNSILEEIKEGGNK